ncbi:response regulator [Planctomycetota bacterium]
MNVGNGRILIIDPDIEAARELSSRLIKEGCDVEICGGVTKAVERIKDAKFDCIILDVDLPEMKGYQAAPILKAVDPKVQIVMTASENTAELEAKVRKQDIFYYFIKSFNQNELQEAVRDVFKKLGKITEVKKMDRPRNVLVIDDDASFVAAIIPTLRSKGYRIDTAWNKEEAIEKINRLKPDLILLDIMLETITDGFHLCYKLKHDPEMKKIPVLAVSAINKKMGLRFSPATDGEYFEADDFVEKPVDPTDLLKRIEKLLSV